MTNKPNTDKTIQQIRDEMAFENNFGEGDECDCKYAFQSGFDAAIQLCEQRERDLVSALEKTRKAITNEFNQNVYLANFGFIEEALKKHRGENDSKD